MRFIAGMQAGRTRPPTSPSRVADYVLKHGWTGRMSPIGRGTQRALSRICAINESP
jgi:hypothetical protein